VRTDREDDERVRARRLREEEEERRGVERRRELSNGLGTVMKAGQAQGSTAASVDLNSGRETTGGQESLTDEVQRLRDEKVALTESAQRLGPPPASLSLFPPATHCGTIVRPL
jgi:hypothetical protein